MNRLDVLAVGRESGYESGVEINVRQLASSGFEIRPVVFHNLGNQYIDYHLDFALQ